MKIYKFGGASVKNAKAIQNVAKVIRSEAHFPLLVVVSAMDKTTNALEKLSYSAYAQDGSADLQLEKIRNFHTDTANELFRENANPAIHQIMLYMEAIKNAMQDREREFDPYYDEIVAFGELLSTSLVSIYLNADGLHNIWKDARELIVTDELARAAKVDWGKSTDRVLPLKKDLEEKGIIVSQGFIGKSEGGQVTTLGREGSDFSAAIFASILDANEVVLWKDVAGIYNADPKFHPEAEKIPMLSYYEAIEMTNSGAKVIHPKTMRPLQSKNIALNIRSFEDPGLQGTRIASYEEDIVYPPIIVKTSGIELISLSSKDFSFIGEHDLNGLFSLFKEYRVKTQVLQLAYLSISAGVTANIDDMDQLIEEISENYEVKRNGGLELLTIRHYQEALDPEERASGNHHPSSVKDNPMIKKLLGDRDLILEQRTRTVVRLLYR